ncbi:MAG: hypothetical protein ACOXZ0_08255 [Eubacteriales bacterium]|jgi:hypothetical protein
MADNRNDIILGAGELYLYEYTGSTIPTDAEIETEERNVGHCSGGFVVDYTPEKYDVKNQYGKTVKSFITSEQVEAKTGILTWDLTKLGLLSTAKFRTDTANNKKTLTFGGGGALKTVLLRFVHVKEDGRKLRFTMIGQGGNGFSIEFGQTELVVDAAITAIEYIKNFLAIFEEELFAPILSVTATAVQNAEEASTIDLTATVEGGTEPYTYVWYEAAAAEGPFTTIVGATSATYADTGNVSGTYHYKVKATDANGLSLESAPVSVTITV